MEHMFRIVECPHCTGQRMCEGGPSGFEEPYGVDYRDGSLLTNWIVCSACDGVGEYEEPVELVDEWDLDEIPPAAFDPTLPLQSAAMTSALNTKAHYDLMLAFERQSKGLPTTLRYDREPRSFWAGGNVYQDSKTNDLFLAYRLGHAEGRCVERDEVAA